MSVATAAPVSARPPAPARQGSSTRFVLLAFLSSRLIVLAGALAGALLGHRQQGWAMFDPTRLTQHLGAVGNVLAAGAVRWDSIHYLAIAAHGYSAAGDTVFFPLYPMLIAAVAPFTGSAVIAGTAISAVAFVVALVLLHRLTRLELGERAADVTVLLLCFAPLSLFFTAVYTESLFLALSVGAILAARQSRFPLACALAALASLTRVPGVLLAVPIAMQMIGARRAGGIRTRELSWIALIPASASAFPVYLSLRGYGLLAPITNQASGQHGHSFAGPFGVLVNALQAASSGVHALFSGAQPFYGPTLSGPLSLAGQDVLLIAVLGIAVAALVACIRRLPASYAAYAALVLIVCLSSGVDSEPLKSLDRYVLTIFPLWMVAGAVLARSSLKRPAIGLGAVLLAFYSFQFATWAFVA